MPSGANKRQLLDQATYFSVAYSTLASPFHGPHAQITLLVQADDRLRHRIFIGIPTLDSLLSRLKRSRDENRLEKQLRQWVYPKVLILDEMSYLPLSQ